MASISDEDLRAAVGQGLIGEAEAARLSAFADERAGLRLSLPKEDEPFEFFRGFGEIFIAVGLILLLIAFYGWSAILVGAAAAWAGAVNGVFTCAILWGLAGYFTRRRRMSLPSIVLAAGFAVTLGLTIGFVLVTLDQDPTGFLDGEQAFGGAFWLLLAVAGFAGMIVYFRWFRLPFALFPAGVYGIGVVLAAILMAADVNENVDGFAEALFDLTANPAVAFGILAFGLIAFAVAMRFEMRDPHRVTRHAASAFWLHLLAAPAIVNTVCLTLYNMGGAVGYLASAAAFAAVACVAIVIDRRSFLMAGVVYLGLAIGWALDAVGEATGLDEILTIAVLGLIITVLGAKWAAARRALMSALPDFPGKDRLPPY